MELPACEPLVRGRATIEQRYRTFFSGPVKRSAFTFSPLEARIEGNVGHAVGTYDRRLVLPSGQMVSETGKYVVILRRVDSEWKAHVRTVALRPTAQPVPVTAESLPP